jgi:hypothetical protein
MKSAPAFLIFMAAFYGLNRVVFSGQTLVALRQMVASVLRGFL